MKDWKVWLKGLVSAAIGGAATAISTMIVAPDQFNLAAGGFKNLMVVSAISALVSVAGYLKQSPLPNGEGK